VNYPGNPSLAAPVKDRVVSTFQQTLALYKQGRKDEVIAGCGLMLQMDPTFEPAKKLLEKTKNPALPIDVDAFFPPSDIRPLIDQAREAMAARDFQRVHHLTTEILTNDLMNDDARILGDEAREKLEAVPFIEQFARKCETNIKSGNYAAAKSDLEKARALDASHPEVLRLTQALAQRQSGPKPVPPQPSFVVDSAPQSTGRAASQASDFGFTFEEEKPHDAPFANFSFDSPSDSPFSFGGAAPAKPAGAEFDFSTASVGTSPDDQKKIEQYLADGDKSFAAGDHLQAIDLWSRIFLIDVTNEQASERIEKAKAKRREIEQKVDALLASGLAAMERKDSPRARAEFEEALRLDPGNATARGYLDEVSKPAVQAAAAAAPAAFLPDADEKIDLDFFDEEIPSGIDAPLMPPSPFETSAAAAAPAKESKKAKAISPPRQLPTRAIAIVLAVLVLGGGGGWFAYQKFFNKSDEETTTTDSQAVLSRAKTLAGLGKYDDAIKLLQDIKAGDAQHDAALRMMDDLKHKQAGSAAFIDGKPAAQYYDEKVAAARAAFAQHDYATAKTAFEDAQRVKPLAPDAKAEYDTAANQVAQLDSAKKLFTEQRYDEAIASLQPILTQDPQNATVQRMIVDAHFNLGAKALQEERTTDAITQFDEVLKVTPTDELAKRSRELAQRYDKQGKDLLYQIYVKYLPLRQAT
jgi:tetratricopeptide (TPR) repeat protein